MKIIKTSLFLIVLCFASLLSADDIIDTGDKTHDGFYFRLLTGLGYGSVRTRDYNGEKVNLKEEWGLSGFQIGGAFKDNAILFFELVSSGSSRTDYDESSGMRQKTSLYGGGVGLGLCYYFMPKNVYVTATLSFPAYELSANNYLSDVDASPALNFSLGKELWISKNWGIGLGLFFSFFNPVSDAGNIQSQRIYGWFGAVCISATYN